MKTDLRYQNGCLYEHHGAWYVRYRQRISQEGGATKRNHASKHLGRSVDFPNIFTSNDVGHPSCKSSIAIASVYIRE
jgi:hypothetical protein